MKNIQTIEEDFDKEFLIKWEHPSGNFTATFSSEIDTDKVKQFYRNQLKEIAKELVGEEMLCGYHIEIDGTCFHCIVSSSYNQKRQELINKLKELGIYE